MALRDLKKKLLNIINREDNSRAQWGTMSPLLGCLLSERQEVHTHAYAEKNPCTRLVGIYMGTTTVEHNTKIPQRLKWNYHTMQQSPWADGHRKGKISKSFICTTTTMFIYTLFTISQGIGKGRNSKGRNSWNGPGHYVPSEISQTEGGQTQLGVTDIWKTHLTYLCEW